MKLKTVAIAVSLAVCAAIAGADEKGVEPKTYVSADLLGIVMGNYQLALEVPVTDKTSLIAEGQYYNWQYGAMPKLMSLYMDFISSMSGVDDMGDYGAIFDELEMYGGGGTIGFAKYINRKGTFATYYAGSLSYSYFHLGLDMDALYTSSDPDAQPMGSIDMPIHAGSIAGRIGGKYHLGPVAVDLFYMMSLNGVYFDLIEMYRGLGLDEQTIGMMERFYLSLGSVTLMPGGGFGLRFSLAF